MLCCEQDKRDVFEFSGKYNEFYSIARELRKVTKNTKNSGHNPDYHMWEEEDLGRKPDFKEGLENTPN